MIVTPMRPLAVVAPTVETTFTWHGLDIVSALPLAFAAGPAALGAPHRLRIVSDAGLALPTGPCLRTSKVTGYQLYRDPVEGCWLARDGDRMQITRDVIRVTPAPLDPVRLEYLRTRALALWLNVIGMPPIHASAVASETGAIALLGKSGAGKSTLAAALVNFGYRLCADDLLPLAVVAGEVPVYPGAQRLGLWPDSAQHFHPDALSLPSVTPDTAKRRLSLQSALPERVPRLRAIFVLERGDPNTSIRIEKLPGSQGMLALLIHGQMAGFAESLGLGGSRLRVFTEVLDCVSVYALRYPSDFAALPDVCAALDVVGMG
ncbi:MAG: hypothetical protein ACT4NL_17420 [Pseudomarimonas sp.]